MEYLIAGSLFGTAMVSTIVILYYVGELIQYPSRVKEEIRILTEVRDMWMERADRFYKEIEELKK